MRRIKHVVEEWLFRIAIVGFVLSTFALELVLEVVGTMKKAWRYYEEIHH